jgi:O-antigen ligase
MKPVADWPLPVRHLLYVWALTLFDFHFFLANVVAQPFVYLLHFGYPLLFLVLALKAPAVIAREKPWVWYAPLLIIVLIAGVTLPFAANKNLAKVSLLFLMNYYALALATAVYIRTARQAMPIVIMLFAQFAWYAVWAGAKGLVPWHPTLANYDGFAGLMVHGAGLCYWFAVAAKGKKTKLFLYALAGYCVLGVVASFARAAFLALIVVVGWVWMRSPRKMLTAAGIVGAGIVAAIGATVIFEEGFFWNEMMSAFEEGTEEGTGAQRWEVWKVGFKVWMTHPIFGVGAGNFGAFAAGYFRFGELPAFPNPNMLYGFNLHNSYMQILAEFGLVGVLAFGWALWDFQKRNREIRTAAAGARWAQSNPRWELRYLALGLEAANLGNVLCAAFYATLFMPWFFTIWAANRMLWAVTRPGPGEVAPLRRSAAGRAQPLPRPSEESRTGGDPAAAPPILGSRDG